MQVLSLITSFLALRQALLREESEKILLLSVHQVGSKRNLLIDGIDQPSHEPAPDEFFFAI